MYKCNINKLSNIYAILLNPLYRAQQHIGISWEMKIMLFIFVVDYIYIECFVLSAERLCNYTNSYLRKENSIWNFEKNKISRLRTLLYRWNILKHYGYEPRILYYKYSSCLVNCVVFIVNIIDKLYSMYGCSNNIGIVHHLFFNFYLYIDKRKLLMIYIKWKPAYKEYNQLQHS